MDGTLIRLRWTKKEGSNIILYISIVKMLWNGILISKVIMFSDFRAFEICNELYKCTFWTMYNMPAILANNVCRKLEIVTYLYLLYPTQRVAEDLMFLTRPSVSQSVSPSVLFFLLAQLLWNRSTEFCETL